MAQSTASESGFADLSLGSYSASVKLLYPAQFLGCHAVRQSVGMFVFGRRGSGFREGSIGIATARVARHVTPGSYSLGGIRAAKYDHWVWQVRNAILVQRTGVDDFAIGCGTQCPPNGQVD